MLNNTAFGTTRLRIKQPVYTSDKRAKFTQRENKKWIRFCTVIGYIFFVSLPAISLSVYYIWIWDPDYISRFPPDKNRTLASTGYTAKPISSTKQYARQRQRPDLFKRTPNGDSSPSSKSSSSSSSTSTSISTSSTTTGQSTTISEQLTVQRPSKVIHAMLKQITPSASPGQRIVRKPDRL